MGFFFKDQERKKGKKRASSGQISVDSLKVFHRERCNACPLDQDEDILQHPKMEATGAKYPVVYILGEAPGSNEDKVGEQFVGDAGEYLRPEIPKRWRSKVRWNNTIRCHPPKNRNPLPIEIECCRQWIVEDIERSKPRAIFGFGNVPLNWMMGRTGMGLWRGRRIPVRVGTHECWFFPMYHPSYAMRIANSKGELEQDILRIYFRDIDNAFAFLENDDSTPYVESGGYTDNIEWVFGEGKKDFDQVRRWLDELLGNELQAIDIETQNLRPYSKGSKLLTVAIGTYEQTYAFPVDHPHAWGLRLRDQVVRALEDFLYDAGTLIVQNLTFEMEWFAWYYGGLDFIEDRFGKWEDTMSASYVMDMRKFMHAMETQTLLHLGFDVKALSPKMNKANMVDEPLEKVLPYNGMDTKYTDKLFEVEMEKLDSTEFETVLPAYGYHVDLCSALVAAQYQGVMPNKGALKELGTDLEKRIAELEKAIQNDKSVRKFKKKYRSFDPYSTTKDLLIFFRDFLAVEEGISHKNKQGYATDDKMLNKIKDKYPIARLLQELRQAAKNYTTYIVGTEKQVDQDDRIHTNYTHTFTSTTRLSSEDPNLQNYPARKDHHIRAVISADPGCLLVAFDYGQIDARNIAMYSGDKNYHEALFKNYDVHMVWAEKIADSYPRVLDITIEKYELPKRIDDADLMKKFRSLSVKNEWTFPLFYGATTEQVAGHLRVPERKMEPLVEEFWDYFWGVKKWQEELIETYREVGYVDSLNGHRMHGPLKTNELLNRPIQCATAEIVGDAMIRTGLIGYWANMQIHDDLTFNLVDDNTLERSIAEIAKTMCLVPFNWITVPIVVEVKTGYDWHNMEDYGEFTSEDYK